MRRWIIAVVLIGIAISGTYYFVNRRSPATTAAETPATMAVPVSRQNLSRTINASGRLEPLRDVEIAFGGSGTIVEMNAQVGDRVEAGAVLGRLDPRDIEIDLIRARREYEQARLDATESVKEEKRIAYELVQERAQGADLVAPFDGLIVEVMHAVGDSATSQGAAARMIDTSSYIIIVDIDQLDLRHVRENQDVIVSVDAFPELRLEGSVTAVGWLPASSSGVVSYPVEVTVPAADSTALRPGLTVQVEIVVASVEDALVVPLAAVVEDGPSARVTRINADGREEIVTVETGMSDAVWVEIRSGLTEDDRVLMNNYQLYSDLVGGSRGGSGGGQSFGSFGGGTIRLPAVGR